ncbi:MAG: hypothetical protein LBE08_06510 [Bifidobacteriaceae bacterium]|jgi:hypothetical protein|nr:hypothetical protein [Bifidobacteriaceae bacterium]
MRTLITSVDSIGRGLARTLPFDRVYAAEAVEQAARDDLDQVTVTALAPLAWATNQAASEDLMSIRRFQEVLATCRISHLTLISTCAVYPVPYQVDESSPIDPAFLPPYARHRHDLEQWCLDRWDATVVRLPHVFGGPHRSEVRNPASDLARFAALNPASTTQHYDLARLGGDLEAIYGIGLRLVNLVTPPLTSAQVLTDLLGVPFMPGADAVPPVQRDVRSRYAGLLGGRDGYLETAEQALVRIAMYMGDRRPVPAGAVEGG